MSHCLHSPSSNVLASFRRFLKRQGFYKPQIKRADKNFFPGDVYVVSFYDEMNGKHFCRTYNTYDMKAIIHSSDVFWRFL